MLLILRVEREGNFAVLSTVFFDLKIRDEILGFEVLKKSYDDISGALALFLVGAVHIAFGENVIKGNGGFKLFVKFDFANATYDIMFTLCVFFC